MRSLVLGIGLGLAASCTDDNSVVGLGVLTSRGDPHVTLPDVVGVGEVFTLEVQTYGNSCFTAESTDVEMTNEAATVTVYDRDPRSRCTADIAAVEHHATLRFDTAGMKSITIHGWDMGHHDFYWPVTVTAE